MRAVGTEYHNFWETDVQKEARIKIGTECKALMTHGPRSLGDGGLVVHACQESTNLRRKGRNKLRLFKACNYVCSMRSRRKPSPAVTEGSVLHTAVLKSAIMLKGKKKNPWVQPRLTGVCTWAEVCHRCVFSARPVEFFRHEFLTKSDSFLRGGASALRKQMPSSSLTQRVVQELLCGWALIHGQKWGQ